MTSLEAWDLECMGLALSQARLADGSGGEVPIGAVLAVDGVVVAQAHNQRESWQDPTAHAEILVLREAGPRLGRWRLTDATLYVTVEPCVMCAGAVVLARVARVVYGCTDPKAGGAGSILNLLQHQRLNHRVEVVRGLLEDECQGLLQAFFRRLRERQPSASHSQSST